MAMKDFSLKQHIIEKYFGRKFKKEAFFECAIADVLYKKRVSVIFL